VINGTNPGGGAGGSATGTGRGRGGSVSGGDYNRVYKSRAPRTKVEAVTDSDSPAPKLSPAEEKRQRLTTKLNPSLVALVDRLKDRKAKPGADEARFVRDGRAEIQIWLTDKSEKTIAQLKQLGFEVVLDPKTSRLVIGRLPIEKLAALAELTFVRYVAPQMSGSQ
jgi:hypothetical protein